MAMKVLNSYCFDGGKWIIARTLTLLGFFGLLIYGIIYWIPRYVELNYGKPTDTRPDMPMWWWVFFTIFGILLLILVVIRERTSDEVKHNDYPL